MQAIFDAVGDGGAVRAAFFVPDNVNALSSEAY
jgi:hypothetical protein